MADSASGDDGEDSGEDDDGGGDDGDGDDDEIFHMEDDAVAVAVDRNVKHLGNGKHAVAVMRERTGSF